MNIPNIMHDLGWCIGVVDSAATHTEGTLCDLLLNVAEKLEMVGDEILKDIKEGVKHEYHP